jgi:hypothetical protein
MGFQDPDGWKDLLRQAVASEPLPSRWASLPAALEPLFAGFTASPTSRLLTGAKVCHRDVEFLTTLEGVGAGSLKIQGVLDCLCQDAQDDWHLVVFTLDRVPPEDRAQDWNCREPGLALAARAVQPNPGIWPKSVTIYYFAESAAVTHPGHRLRRPAILTTLAARLTESLSRPTR